MGSGVSPGVSSGVSPGVSSVSSDVGRTGASAARALAGRDQTAVESGWERNISANSSAETGLPSR